MDKHKPSKSEPLVVYLDTQDYIRIFNEPSHSAANEVFQKILAHKDREDIVVGYSWAIMIEFITKPMDHFREERARRGKLISQICGRNAFPFLSDLRDGARFPNNGIWLGGPNDRLVSAKRWRKQMEQAYQQALLKQKDLNREQRRRLKTKSGMQQLLRENSFKWGSNREDFGELPVSDELIESGIINRFIKGRCSDREFEERVNRWLWDPTEFSRIMYDYAGKPNLIDHFLGDSINKTEQAFAVMLSSKADLEEKAKKLRGELFEIGLDKGQVRKVMKPLKQSELDTSDTVRKIEEHVGEGRADHIAYYMRRVSEGAHTFKRSDLMDLVHMCYVPECDIFRCDKAMAELFRDYEPFNGKLLAKFLDLPSRIESILAARG